MGINIGYEQALAFFSIGVSLLKAALIVACAVAGVHLVLEVIFGLGKE